TIQLVGVPAGPSNYVLTDSLTGEETGRLGLDNDGQNVHSVTFYGDTEAIAFHIDPQTGTVTREFIGDPADNFTEVNPDGSLNLIVMDDGSTVVVYREFGNSGAITSIEQH